VHGFLHPWRHVALVGGLTAVVGLAALGAAALGLQSIAPITDPTSLRRIAFENLIYEGAFRLPASDANGDTFSFGGRPMAYNPQNNSLFVGARSLRVAEVSIPQPGKTSDINELPMADYLQPFEDPTEGHMKEVSEDGTTLAGLLVHERRLVGTGVIYYDANNTQTVTHFTRPLSLAERAVKGMVRVGQSGKSGFTAGYMASVPPEWQSRLGGPAITGQCCLSIISRTSHGPAAFAFDPAGLSAGKNVPAEPLLYYPMDHPTLGSWEGSNPTYGGTTQVGGAALIAGTSTALFVGRNGSGAFCYGEGSADRAAAETRAADGGKICFDPTSSDKGQHAYPYRYQMWAYDLNELAEVRAGRRDPWSVKPYGVWPFELPFPEPSVRIGGVAYDAARQRIFIAQSQADRDGYAFRPLIHVFRVQ
jgi:hypothetical protein